MKPATSISSWTWSRAAAILDLGGLLMDLQDLLGRKVDVVTERGLRDRIRQRVQEQAVPP